MSKSKTEKPSDYLNKYVGNTPENVERMRKKFNEDGTIFKKFPYLTKGDYRDFHVFYEYIENKHLLEEKKIFPFENTRDYSFLYWFLDEIVPQNWDKLGKDREKKKFSHGYYLNMSEIIEQKDINKYQSLISTTMFRETRGIMPKPPLEEKYKNSASKWSDWKKDYARWKNQEYKLHPELSRSRNERSAPSELDESDDEDNDNDLPFQGFNRDRLPQNISTRSRDVDTGSDRLSQNISTRSRDVDTGSDRLSQNISTRSRDQDTGSYRLSQNISTRSRDQDTGSYRLPRDYSTTRPRDVDRSSQPLALKDNGRLSFEDILSNFSYRNNSFILYSGKQGIELGLLYEINPLNSSLRFKDENNGFSEIYRDIYRNLVIVTANKGEVSVNRDYYFQKIPKGGKRSRRKTKKNKNNKRKSKRSR